MSDNSNQVSPQNTIQTYAKMGDEENGFIAEIEVMDVSHLRDEMFLVAVSTGDRNKLRFLSTTVRGPYNFAEMCEEVGYMWKEHQHHAKVIICSKKRDEMLKVLDENTVDYIECHYLDLITEAFLDGTIEKQYTCRASLIYDNETAEDEKLKNDL